MITKMTRYSIVLLSGDREKVLSRISDIGLLDIKRSTKPVDRESQAMMERASAIREHIRLIQSDNYARDFQWRTLTARLAVLEKELQYRQLWGEYDPLKMKALEDEGYSFHFHIIPSKKFNPLWKEKYLIEILEDDGSQKRFVAVSGKDGYDINDGECKTPEGPPSETAEQIAAIRKDINGREIFLNWEKNTIPSLEKELSDSLTQFDRYMASLSSTDAAESSVTIFTAFAPSADEDKVCKALDAMDVYYIKEEARKEDNPPIRLHNRWFARQFETLTGMYGMPVYDEFDPTPVLAPFFLLFWSFCMGDAGYGLLLMGVSLILKKVDILGLKNHRKLVATLGAGTFIIGLVLGTFFGVSLYSAEWIPECFKKIMVAGQIEVSGAKYDVQMVASLAIGIFHICLAMIIKGIGITRRFGFKEAISTWGWIVLIVGGLTVAAGSFTKLFGEQVTTIALIAIGVLSFAGIFLFNKPGRNPLLNIGAGLWDTYGMATGILGDVLSYIRIYALGLAGGMLGGAFNTLAAMILQGASNPTWQYLPFVLILILGHALNFAMSCLGAFVHPLRLTFVEYFKNSGYEGKGLKYNPLKN